MKGREEEAYITGSGEGLQYGVDRVHHETRAGGRAAKPGPAYRRTRRAKPEVLRLARCQGGEGRHGPAVPGAAITIPKAVELLTEPT